MKANKTMLIAALAVGSLLVWSPALRADDSTNTPPSTPPAGQPPRGGFERMAEQLNLTADQKPKVQSILQAQMQKMLALRQDTSLTVEDRRAKAKAIHENTAAQMKAVLTADQFQKWQDMQSRMRNRRVGPPPGDNPPPAGTPPPATPPQN